MSAIDVRMIPSKMAFFFLYASIGCIVPFLPVILVSTGLSVRETGLIMGCSLVAGTLFPLFFGWLADSTTHKKLLFVSLLLGYAALLFSLPLMAHFVGSDFSEHSFTSNVSHTNISNTTNGQYSILSNTSAVEVQLTEEFRSNLFFAALVITALGRGFQLSFIGVLDSMVTNVIEQSQTKENYGQQAMFIGLGVALGSIVSGVVTEHSVHLIFSSYMGNFYTFLPCALPVVPLIYVIHHQTSWRHEGHGNNAMAQNTNASTVEENSTEDSQSKRRSKRQQLLIVLKNPDNIIVMVSVFVCGLLRVVSLSFLFLFMEEEMSASKTDMGLAEGIGNLSLFIVFLFSNTIIKSSGGPTVCMELGIAAYCILLLSTSFVRTSWIAIILQVLRGVGVGLFRSSFVKRTAEISPKEIYNILFFINVCLFYAVPGAVGNFAGGIIYHRFKGAAMFQGSSVLGCVWLLSMWTFFKVKQGIVRHRKEESSERVMMLVQEVCIQKNS